MREKERKRNWAGKTVCLKSESIPLYFDSNLARVPVIRGARAIRHKLPYTKLVLNLYVVQKKREALIDEFLLHFGIHNRQISIRFMIRKLRSCEDDKKCVESKRMQHAWLRPTDNWRCAIGTFEFYACTHCGAYTAECMPGEVLDNQMNWRHSMEMWGTSGDTTTNRRNLLQAIHRNELLPLETVTKQKF